MAPTQAPAPTSAPAQKVDFPAKGKSVSLTVPFAAGGSTDLAARFLAPELEKILGVPVEVVNKPGANAQVAATDLAKSKPDGYSLAFLPASIVTSYLDPERKAQYTRKDFQPIAMYFLEPNATGVQADGPYKTMKDLVDAAKPKPGQLKMGTGGVLSAPHLAVLMLEKVTGVKFASVHFDGGAPPVTALLGGHVDASTVSAGSFSSAFKAGTVRVVGILDTEESKFFPGVKTAEAQGVKVYMSSQYGVNAPAGTPKEAVEVLANAIKQAMGTDFVKNKMNEASLTLRYLGPEQYAAFWSESEADVKGLMDLAQQK